MDWRRAAGETKIASSEYDRKHDTYDSYNQLVHVRPSSTQLSVTISVTNNTHFDYNLGMCGSVYAALQILF